MAIKRGQSRETNTNKVNKTWTLLQTTGGEDDPNIVFTRKSYRTSQHELRTLRNIIEQQKKLLRKKKSNTNSTKNLDWTQVSTKGTQILPRRRHPPWYLYIQSISLWHSIPPASPYGLYISQMMWYSKAYGSHQKFLARMKRCFEKENHRVKGS
jgi:hypothetical protein